MVAVATDDGLALDTLAASLRADAGDLKVFVEVLARKLAEALPGRVVVQRKGLRGRSRPVRRLELTVGESRFELDNDQGHVQTRRRALVRGVALSTKELPLERWLDELAAALVTEASHSEDDRLALERLLAD